MSRDEIVANETVISDDPFRAGSLIAKSICRGHRFNDFPNREVTSYEDKNKKTGKRKKIVESV